MTGMSGYAVAFGCIFAVNLLPAFGPPTWAVLLFFKLDTGLSAVPLILGGALAAASGRLVLASASRRLRGRFSPRRRQRLAAAQRALTGNRRRAAGGLALFALSPVPSAQLFVAAGLLDVPLVPLTSAFFAGRLVSYSLYVGGGSLAQHSLEGVLTNVLGSPLGIALQIAMLVGLVALVRVDWARVLARHAGEHAGVSAPSRPPRR
jgi:uncharacterized membrane protein YdjX (TVP38/TMEM64 family)